MHIKRILLGVIHGNSTISSHGITRRVVVLTIVSCQHVLIDRIFINHIPIGITRTFFGIMIDTVTYNRAPLVFHHRPTEKLRCFRFGIIITILTVDVTTARRNV